MATMNVLDSGGATVAVEKPLAPGQAAMAASRPVTIASDQSAVAVKSADGDQSTVGAKADAAYTGSGAASVIAALKGLYASLVAATPAGENTIGSVVSKTAVVSTSFARPADTTAYTAGDLVANSTTAGSVTPMALTVARANDKPTTIRKIRLTKTGTSITNASFRVHLYRTSPTVTNGDNGAWLTTESNYIGSFTITMDRVFSDGAKGIAMPDVGVESICIPSSGTQTVYALVEARNAYTPVSGETFTVIAEVIQD